MHYSHLVASARPNFMKIAPLYHALKKTDWANPVIVHTGQHYDVNMSDAFFKDLRLPDPHVHLGVGSGTHAEQTGKVMMAYEKALMEKPPALTVVVGDVNSTVAATLAAVKLGIRTAHLEAGLRSFDRTMPEEINRVLTDAIADILWTPSADGDENLIREGIAPEKIERVGNIMIDSLEMLRPVIEKENSPARYGLNKTNYGLVTLHRPANVDDKEKLHALCEGLVAISKKIPLVFPVHPRTKKNLETFGLIEKLASTPDLHINEPVSYIPFMNLVFNSRLAITDSGGLQEETTYLGIPCLTLRPNTERPVTVNQGTNRLCSAEDLLDAVSDLIDAGKSQRSAPDLWDGRTADRVVESIRYYLNNHFETDHRKR
jgi:UDP-N-acetylglucosamine 2-epimerase (non-hydrolysing)